MLLPRADEAIWVSIFHIIDTSNLLFFPLQTELSFVLSPNWIEEIVLLVKRPAIDARNWPGSYFQNVDEEYTIGPSVEAIYRYKRWWD